ncbi:hypothetical protein BGX26_011124 [Mortierella sp. AD094]|nr:hypothetical protein BGX26_011124 [Mortierella sp. AD094]
MEKSAVATVLETPELLNVLTLHLKHSDLLSCIQVSSHWHWLFSPALWHTIDDNLCRWGSILHNCYRDPSTTVERQANIFKLLAKYGQHIRYLAVHWNIMVEAASVSGVCTNLRFEAIYASETEEARAEQNFKRWRKWGLRTNGNTSEADTTLFSDPILPIFKDTFKKPVILPRQIPRILSEYDLLEDTWVFTQHYWNLIMTNPHVYRLCLNNAATFQWELQSNEFFYRILSNMKELKDLESNKFLDPACLWNLPTLAPNIDKVTLGSLFKGGDDGSQLSSNPAIKSLNINTDVSASTLQKILSAFTNLEDLTVASFTNGSLISEEQTLLSSPIPGSKLKSLATSDLEYSGDLLASVAIFLPNLTKLRTGHLSETVVRALVMHCRNLEIVISGRDPYYPGEQTQDRLEHDPINQLFVSCPNLKVFNGIEHYLNADDLIRQPWACHGLEKLRCRIVGIERLDEEEETIYDAVTAKLGDGTTGLRDDVNLSEEERAVVQKVKQSREQQWKVYARLASLKSLKCLDMGYESRDSRTYKNGERYISEYDGVEYLQYEGPIQDTLELSLDSGLDLLGELKDLEMFGFEAVNHRITKKELDWMAKSWPKLTLMYGLNEDALPDIEFDRKKAELRDYMKELRPDVEYDSLYAGE